MNIDYQSAQRYAKASVISIVGLQDADDVLQDAALLAWQKREQFRAEAEFATWFYTVAKRAALYHLRKKNAPTRDARCELPIVEALTVANGEEPQDARVDRLNKERELYEAIAQLGRRRKLAALRWLAGEGARGAEKAARHKAKVQLREMLS